MMSQIGCPCGCLGGEQSMTTFELFWNLGTLSTLPEKSSNVTIPKVQTLSFLFCHFPVT